MTYVKVNGIMHEAVISGRTNDGTWDGRESKTIRMTMTSAAVAALLPDDTPWSIVHDAVQDDGSVVQEEYDNSAYCISGEITDRRDGTVSIKMGKPTDLELAYELLYG